MSQTVPPLTLVSIVCPCFNEEDGLREFVQRIGQVMRGAGQPYEIVFVNDGSRDGTLALMHELAEAERNITVVNFSRNFGKEIALTAGLCHATGDAVIAIDADLQDPPALIPTFLERYREGYDVVYGRRIERQGDSWLKKTTAHGFYRVMRRLGPVPLPANVGDFRLMSRRAVSALLRLPEAHRFMKGLFAWVGFKSCAVDYVREPRFSGTSKWKYAQLLNLSIEGITSFTTVPLRLTTYLGFLIALFAFGGGAYYLIRTLLIGEDVQGFPTLFLTILLLGGVQLIALGVIGEYLGRIFNETKRRPLFLVDDIHWSEAGASRRKDRDAFLYGIPPVLPVDVQPRPQPAGETVLPLMGGAENRAR
ncbi:glycosyltransferase family 2 protein [Paracoccus litorisediminis]|uniref:Glycosyltransferase n=1 Tax=Paracoccus litorisediminis TaxID=2006130 RepID=A0A844HPA0_9RHOB|nr:glycosyltransferase family 2 protein [Paracoccus litorisediminis]MTH60949.1 glycosyltransferase [Paracoccus litorisediminis]